MGERILNYYLLEIIIIIIIIITTFLSYPAQIKEISPSPLLCHTHHSYFQVMMVMMMMMMFDHHNIYIYMGEMILNYYFIEIEIIIIITTVLSYSAQIKEISPSPLFCRTHY